MSLEAFMRKHIFEPLSISSMTFHPAELKAFAPTSYRSTTSTPSITSGEHPVYAFPTPSELGGFGLYGNSTDFAKVLSAILTSLQDSSSSELKVSSALVSEIFASQLGPKPTEAFQGLRSAAPPAVFAAGSLPTDAPLGYGFSVTVNTSDIPGMRRSGSGGWWGYPNTYYVCSTLLSISLAVVSY
jgi:CubicO group peptidase (beta-lactamase class C family)